jgi:hypothetical protein
MHTNIIKIIKKSKLRRGTGKKKLREKNIHLIFIF